MSIIEVDMTKGESVTANVKAIVYISGYIDVDTKIRGAFFAKLGFHSMRSISFC